MNTFTFDIPTRLLFGAGTLNRLAEEKLPGKKALIVVSRGKSVRENGVLARTEALLEKSGIARVVFGEIEANPLRPTVMKGAAAARGNGCDFVLALGGGSVMDASKMIAAMATNDGDLWDYAQTATGGKKIFPNAPLPIVAVTTTAGTGSEIDPGAVISDDERREKPGFVDARTFPRLAVVDPELMRTVPPKFTAFQGFDALFHAVEGYVSGKANWMSETYAIAAIEHIGRHLARAVADGNDLDAREHVAFGNTLSGLVMSTGALTSEHSLEHALSAFHHALPHGAGLVMISLAYFGLMIENGLCPERFVRMAKALGDGNASRPEDFLVELKKLQDACGVGDLKMSDYGIVPEEFPLMAKNARETMRFLFECDRKPLSDADIVAIYTKSYR